MASSFREGNLLIFINDDESIVQMLNAAFSESPRLQGIKCRAVRCLSSECAIRAIQRIKPDVVFLDHQLSSGGNEGLEIANRLKADSMGVKKIISTTQDVDMIPEYAKLGIPHVQIWNLTSVEKAIIENANSPG